MPEDWIRAYVVAIFKKGNKHDASKCRPISLTCISCKIKEHIITSNLMKHAQTHHLLYDLLHGFRDKRSCETQLFRFQANVLRNMEEGSQTDTVILDFSKAFDKVGHRRLIHKLEFYGIQGKTSKWIESFLANRTQTVVLEGEKSNIANVHSGVPQGSVLGPCLFLFYINDLPGNLGSNVRLFADDTIVYIAVSSNSDCLTLQEDLIRLEEWETKWCMEFHSWKCQVLTISRKRKPMQYDYILHWCVLEHVTIAKYPARSHREWCQSNTKLPWPSPGQGGCGRHGWPGPPQEYKSRGVRVVPDVWPSRSHAASQATQQLPSPTYNTNNRHQH